MELRIKELCREKGLRMSDLAEKMGVNQANLAASLKGNPTLSRLQDVANILGVEIQELFPRKSKERQIDGFVEIGGETLRLTGVEDWAEASGMIPGFPKITYYEKVSYMRESVRQFVHRCLHNTSENASLAGNLMGTETFVLAFHPDCLDDDQVNGIFLLTLVARGCTFCYEQIAYGCDGRYDIDGPMGMIKEICNDLEWQHESCDSIME